MSKFELETLSELYKIGRGPSSSHTIGPYRALQWYIKQFPNVKSFEVTLYGSLALTGKGHWTDVSMQDAIGKMPLNIIWDTKTHTDHPNTMDVVGYDENKKPIKTVRVISQGGGSFSVEGYDVAANFLVYPHQTFAEIKQWCKQNNKDLVDYVKTYDINGYNYLSTVWNTMEKAVQDGLNGSGMFEGPIKQSKLTKLIMDNLKKNNVPQDSRFYAMAYAYSVAEMNVQHGYVVTAPTLGSAGILPGVLYYCKHNLNYPQEKIIDMLAVAGIIGILYKKHGTVSGAAGGCQAECGTACSMMAAAYAWGLNANIEEIEAAAIIGLEHHLGLTCDTVLGFVTSPCVERNGSVALRCIDAAYQAIYTSGKQDLFNLDDIVIVENRTGRDLTPPYRETGLGGLSLRWKEKNHCPLDDNNEHWDK